MKVVLIIYLCGIFGFTTAARILTVLHMPTKSHHIVGESLVHGLAAKGHDVTLVSPFSSKTKTPNVREIYLDGVLETNEIYRPILQNKMSISSFWKMGNFTSHLTDVTIRSQAMQKLINSGEKFDVVIIEPFGCESFFGLGHIFNAHIIMLSTGGSMLVNRMAGNVVPYSFVPSVMTTFSDKMTFIQRFLNTFAIAGFDFLMNLNLFTQKKLYEEIFKGAPEFEEAIKNASLYLINSHVIFETPRPYLPNMIPIGGMHIKNPKKLPQDLQEYLDNSKDGVILFSLGSNLRSKDLPLETRTAILKTFAKLPQNILWKFEDENLPEQPKNVKISKWLPQSDILAHPNVKLFITHGGLLSSTEAVYRGVPILGIPFYADQHSNIATFVSAGYGLSLSSEDLNEEMFTKKIKEVLYTPKYHENIKRDSEILKDQPTKPLERAIFWVEHIIRHKGGKHLRSASVDISLAQYLLLDVIGFILFVIGTFIVGIYLCIKTVFRYGKTKKEKANRNKKRKNE